MIFRHLGFQKTDLHSRFPRKISRDFSFHGQMFVWLNKLETEQNLSLKTETRGKNVARTTAHTHDNGLIEGGLGLFMPSGNGQQDEQIPVAMSYSQTEEKKRKNSLVIRPTIINQRYIVKNQ